MAENTKIEWVDSTFNPLWGCLKVSAGCTNCYAEGVSHRYGHDVWGPPKSTPRRTFSANHWKEPVKWDRKAREEGVRATVFCGSMCDVGEDHPQWVAERVKLVDLIDLTPNLCWLLLTKRPDNFMRLFDAACYELFCYGAETWLREMGDRVWVGTSVEDQENADKRIPILFTIPAAIRFLSVEPLLGPVDLWAARYRYPEGHLSGAIGNWGKPGIHWVIVGGESGPDARPMQVDWARRIRDDCTAVGVPYFFKQFGEWEQGEVIDSKDYAGGKGLSFARSGHGVSYETVNASKSHLYKSANGQMFYKTGKKANGRLLDGEEWSQFPTLQADRPPLRQVAKRLLVRTQEAQDATP